MLSPPPPPLTSKADFEFTEEDVEKWVKTEMAWSLESNKVKTQKREAKSAVPDTSSGGQNNTRKLRLRKK